MQLPLFEGLLAIRRDGIAYIAAEGPDGGPCLARVEVDIQIAVRSRQDGSVLRAIGLWKIRQCKLKSALHCSQVVAYLFGWIVTAGFIFSWL